MADALQFAAAKASAHSDILTRWNVLTGADRDRIVAAVRTFKPPAAHPPLYGDGQAAEKIFLAICQESLNLS